MTRLPAHIIYVHKILELLIVEQDYRILNKYFKRKTFPHKSNYQLEIICKYKYLIYNNCINFDKTVSKPKVSLKHRNINVHALL